LKGKEREAPFCDGRLEEGIRKRGKFRKKKASKKE
jgi:hypothetical protein